MVWNDSPTNKSSHIKPRPKSIVIFSLRRAYLVPSK